MPEKVRTDSIKITKFKISDFSNIRVVIPNVFESKIVQESESFRWHQIHIFNDSENKDKIPIFEDIYSKIVFSNNQLTISDISEIDSTYYVVIETALPTDEDKRRLAESRNRHPSDSASRNRGWN